MRSSVLTARIAKLPDPYPTGQVDDEDLEEEEAEGMPPPAPGSGIKLHGPGVGPPGQPPLPQHQLPAAAQAS